MTNTAKRFPSLLIRDTRGAMAAEKVAVMIMVGVAAMAGVKGLGLSMGSAISGNDATGGPPVSQTTVVASQAATGGNYGHDADQGSTSGSGNFTVISTSKSGDDEPTPPPSQGSLANVAVSECSTRTCLVKFTKVNGDSDLVFLPLDEVANAVNDARRTRVPVQIPPLTPEFSVDVSESETPVISDAAVVDRCVVKGECGSLTSVAVGNCFRTNGINNECSIRRVYADGTSVSDRVGADDANRQIENLSKVGLTPRIDASVRPAIAALDDDALKSCREGHCGALVKLTIQKCSNFGLCETMESFADGSTFSYRATINTITKTSLKQAYRNDITVGFGKGVNRIDFPEPKTKPGYCLLCVDGVERALGDMVHSAAHTARTVASGIVDLGCSLSPWCDDADRTLERTTVAATRQAAAGAKDATAALASRMKMEMKGLPKDKAYHPSTVTIVSYTEALNALDEVRHALEGAKLAGKTKGVTALKARQTELERQIQQFTLAASSSPITDGEFQHMKERYKKNLFDLMGGPTDPATLAVQAFTSIRTTGELSDNLSSLLQSPQMVDNTQLGAVLKVLGIGVYRAELAERMSDANNEYLICSNMSLNRTDKYDAENARRAAAEAEKKWFAMSELDQQMAEDQKTFADLAKSLASLPGARASTLEMLTPFQSPDAPTQFHAY